mmetsp:Transcript_20258/g.57006  ORF Transcript_20258/g.57006 Transcript_20258/m.57006 type:complete len:214 (-) Transcript_20258:779-1420(-)
MCVSRQPKSRMRTARSRRPSDATRRSKAPRICSALASGRASRRRQHPAPHRQLHATANSMGWPMLRATRWVFSRLSPQRHARAVARTTTSARASLSALGGAASIRTAASTAARPRTRRMIARRSTRRLATECRCPRRHRCPRERKCRSRSCRTTSTGGTRSARTRGKALGSATTSGTPCRRMSSGCKSATTPVSFRVALATLPPRRLRAPRVC